VSLSDVAVAIRVSYCLEVWPLTPAIQGHTADDYGSSSDTDGTRSPNNKPLTDRAA